MSTELVVSDVTDRSLAALARERFEEELRERIDAAMARQLDRQLAIFLAGERSRVALAEAA